MTVAIEPIAERRSLVWIVWPAFFSACLLEALVFSLVDPQNLRWFGEPLELSRQGEGLAGAAFLAGYADQAHLSHDCRELAGVPPSALLPG